MGLSLFYVPLWLLKIVDKIKYICLIFLSLMLIMGSVFAQDIEVKTYVDRTVIGTGQQFVLTIEVSGGDAQGVSIPDLPDVSAFADFMGSSTSQSFQIINGRMSASKSSVNYFMAREEGKHQLPAVKLSYKGKTFSSQPVSIEIVKGAASPAGQGQPGGQQEQQQGQIVPQSTLEGNLYIEAEVDKREVYVNQPVNVIFKIYTRVNINGFNVIKIPKLVGFWGEEYQMPQQAVTYEKVINGKKYLVAEIKKMALFPTEEGEKEIDPMELELEVRLQERRASRDIFDQFFKDDFFGGFGRLVRTKATSKPIKINVKPLPAKGKPADFNGAVGEYDMKVSLDKEQMKANEAVSLKVKISGTGNIKMLSEPKISFPQDIEKYDPKITPNIDRSGNVIKGSKEFEYVLIPRLAGEYRIKPFNFSYFDTEKGAYRTLTSPQYIINATAGASQGLPSVSGLSKEEIRVLGRDVRFIKMSSETFHRIGDYFYQKIWFKVFLLLPIIALIGAVMYRRRVDIMAGNVAYARNRRANQEAKKRLGQAKKLMKTETQKEFYAEISHALLGYVADKLNLSAAGLISDEVAYRLREQAIDEEIISAFLESLKECDYQRFAPADSILKDMETSYERAREAIVNLERRRLR